MVACSGLLLSAIAQPLAAKNGLWSIYQQSLQNDPQILAAEMTLRSVEQRESQSFSSLLPQLSGSYSLTERSSETLDNNFLPTTTDTSSTALGLTLTQVIYDHSIWKALDISKKQSLKAGADFEAAKQNLMIRVAQAYFDILSAQDGVRFAQAEMEAIKQELEQTNQKFEVGLIAITDVHEARARYDQAVADNIIAQNTLDNAIEALREITNTYYDDLSSLMPKFALKVPEPNNVDDWLSQAEQNNLTLTARKIDKDIARDVVKQSWAGHYPTLNLRGSYSDSESKNKDTNVEIPNEMTEIGVSLSIPIYSGGRTQAKVEETQHLFQQSVHNMEAAFRSANRQTRSAFLGIQASISGVKALEQSTISSKAALEATQAGFEVGTRTIVDVLLSTRTFYNAQRSLSNARYQYIMNTLKLKQAAGILTEQDIQQVDRLLEK